jgi:hypothetical protein
VEDDEENAGRGGAEAVAGGEDLDAGVKMAEADALEGRCGT